MATKKQLISRVEYIKGLIEDKGKTFEYELPKNFKKEDVFEVLKEANKVYKED